MEIIIDRKINILNRNRIYNCAKESKSVIEQKINEIKIKIEGKQRKTNLALKNTLDIFNNENLIRLPKGKISYKKLLVICIASGMCFSKAMMPEIPWPFYLINTRDCFTYDLFQVHTKVINQASNLYL